MIVNYPTIPTRTKDEGQSEAKSTVATPVILFLLAVALPFSFSAGPVVMTGVRMLLIVMVVPMTLRLLSGAYGKILPTDYLFFLHILWVAVAMVVNSPGQAIQNVGSTGIEFLGGYLMGRAYIRTSADMIAMIRLFLFIICCTLPFALIETVTGHPLLVELIAKLPIINGAAQTYDEVRMGLDRVQLAFQTPIHYGLFSMLGFSLCVVGLQGIVSDTRRWFLGGLVGLCVFLSLSSGALLPLLLQIFLIAWSAVFRRYTRRWWLLLGIFLLIYIVIDLGSNRTPMRVFMSYATFSPGTAYMRLGINEAGLENIRANPIFGIGLNDWVRPVWMHNPSFDNFWLLIAMRYGLPGFVALAVGYGLAIWQIGRRDLDANRTLWQLRRAWVFAFSCLALTLYTVHIWSEVYALVFFLFGAGMWLATAVPNEAANRAGPAATLPYVSASRFAGKSAINSPATANLGPPPDAQITSRFTRFAQVRNRQP